MADIRYTPALVIAAGAVFPPLCVALVALRFSTRLGQSSRLTIDDWLVVPALILLCGMAAAMLAGVGLEAVGYPTRHSSPDIGSNPALSSTFQQRTTRQVLWAIEVMQIPALTLVKLSFVLFYRRVFITRIGGKFNIATIAMMCTFIVWGVGFFFAFLFICGSHFSAYWSSAALQEMRCVDTIVLHNSFALSDVITDVMIMVAPVPMIWKLHMSTQKKIAVTGVFSLGALTIAVSVTRAVVFVESTSVQFNPNRDRNLITTGGIYWSFLELGLAICAACLPVLYGLFKGKGLESLRRSLHSMISIRSLSSRSGSRRSSRRWPQPAMSKSSPNDASSSGERIVMPEVIRVNNSVDIQSEPATDANGSKEFEIDRMV